MVRITSLLNHEIVKEKSQPLWPLLQVHINAPKLLTLYLFFTLNGLKMQRSWIGFIHFRFILRAPFPVKYPREYKTTISFV